MKSTPAERRQATSERAVSQTGTGILDARLIILSAGEWTPGGRRELANWLRSQAEQLEEEGEHYGEVFVANREH